MEDILNKIKTMEQNTYLLPDGFSNEIQIMEKQETYKTYVGNRGDNRYITITYTFENQEKLEIKVRNNKIVIDDYNPFERIENLEEKIIYIVNSIYKEKHSFIENAEGIKSLRRKITELKRTNKYNEQEIDKIRNQIEDYLKLKKEVK